MRIAVNTRFLLKGKLEGLGIYTQEIFSRLVRLMPEQEFYFFFDRPYDESFVFAENVIPVVVPPPARHPMLWYTWFEFSVPYYLKKHGIGLFISPDSYASLSTAVPQILTIHDLGFEHFPGHVPLLERKYYRYFMPRFAQKAKQIVAVSDYTRHDIERQYHIPAEKIQTIYNGFDFDETALAGVPVDELLQQNALIQKEYFVFIGAVHPRKNVAGIVRAFEIFKQQTRSTYKLLLIGRNAWLNGELEKEIQQSVFRNDIVWITEIERNKLLKLLQTAYALVFPSFFEGFGIPVLEAMKLSVPVLTSNVSALPEVSGDAALLCDPFQPEDIAAQMLRIVNDKSLYRDLAEKGKTRAKFFSWDKSAGQWSDLVRKQLRIK